jgi:hypothetical protein
VLATGYPGSNSDRRTTASDFNGSIAIFVSMKSHLEHSKVRFSDPLPQGSIRDSIIRIWHLGHRGRSSVAIGKIGYR